MPEEKKRRRRTKKKQKLGEPGSRNVEREKEWRRKRKHGEPENRNAEGKKCRSEAQVPVRAEEMKQSLRPGWVKSQAGERGGSKAKAEAVNAKFKQRMKKRSEDGSRTE